MKHGSQGEGLGLKRIGMALALLLVVQAAGALADMELFVAANTIGPAQAVRLAARLSGVMGEPVAAVMEEEHSFGERMMQGLAPELAIVRAQEAQQWTQMLLPLREPGLPGRKRTMLPLGLRERNMAIRVRAVEKANMAHLLDERQHPAWYPSEVLQLLDELALQGAPGLAFWPPEEADMPSLEAFLRGVSARWFAPDAAFADEIDEEALQDALSWMEEMTQAGLVDVAGDREEALDAFLAGETAIFIDWTAEESSRCAQEMADGEIVLLPYPSMTGQPHRVGDAIVLCAPRPQSEAGTDAARRAAESAAQPRKEMETWLRAIDSLEGGATLRSLLAQAAADILGGKAGAREAAARIVRALEAVR